MIFRFQFRYLHAITHSPHQCLIGVGWAVFSLLAIFLLPLIITPSIQAVECIDPDISKISQGVKLTLCDGTLAEGTMVIPSNCQADGATGCIADASSYRAGLSSTITPGNIRTGQTIGGINGDYPSSNHPLSGNSTTTDLKSLSATVASGSYEFWDSEGIRYTGTISDPGVITPSASSGNFGVSLYRGFQVDGDANLQASNIRTGSSIFGIAGTSLPQESHSPCTGNEQVGCVTTSTFTALDYTNLSPGNIRNGVVIGGVTGEYPSANFPLAGADGTPDLTSGNFDSSLVSSGNFEWFDSVGNRYTKSGDVDIAAANISSGVTIFGIQGAATVYSVCNADGQVNCFAIPPYKSADPSTLTSWDVRYGKTIAGVGGAIKFFANRADLTTINRTTGTGADNSTSVADPFDTIEDYNSNKSFPPLTPTGFVADVGAHWVMDSYNDSNSNGICDGGESCVFKDMLTGLTWARDDGTTRSWEAAITNCFNLNYGSYTGWRLATQKEILQAYINGIWRLRSSLNLSTGYYFTATTQSNTTYASSLAVHTSQSSSKLKTDTTTRSLCVK